MKELSSAGVRGRVSLRTVLLIRTLFGFYCPCSARADICLLLRLHCFCVSGTTLVIVFINAGSIASHVYIALVEHTLNVFSCLLTGGQHFLDFCKTIEQVDKKLGYNNLLLITPVVQCITIFVLMTNAMAMAEVIIFHEHLRSSSILIAALFFLGIGSTMFSIIYICSLDLLRHRLSLLVCHFKSIFTQNNSIPLDADYHTKAIIDCLNMYKILIDNLNKSLSWPKYQLLLRLATRFSSFIIDGYTIVEGLSVGNISTSGTIVDLARFLLSAIVPCLPAIFSELVIREVENFGKAIGDELVANDETEVCLSLELAAEYLELRPFKVSICRLWALDVGLVCGFLGLCVTTLIFVLQFSGLI